MTDGSLIGFEAAGYKAYTTPPGKHATILWQKAMRDSIGIAFYLNCYVYDNLLPAARYAFEVQFQLQSGDALNVETCQWFHYENEWGHQVWSLEKTEEFFWHLFKHMNFKHYSKND